LGGQIGKVRDGLTDYKLDVAENFASNAGHCESTARLIDALGGVKMSVEGTSHRTPVAVANAKPTVRRLDETKGVSVLAFVTGTAHITRQRLSFGWERSLRYRAGFP